VTEPPSPSDARPERRETPQSLRLRSLTPSYTVDDLEASLRFYVDGLGFTLHERWEDEGELRGVMLVAGSCHVGFSQDDGAKGTGRQKGAGFRVWAETVHDLDALAARAREHGIECDGPKTEPWGSRSLTVVDPDGFKLTFSPPQG
jgi:catechol 2,3-dioxygenase-like lactoylglutathione lyase family enzyme